MADNIATHTTCICPWIVGTIFFNIYSIGAGTDPAGPAMAGPFSAEGET